MLRFDWKWAEPQNARARDERDDPEREPWPDLPEASDLRQRYVRVDLADHRPDEDHALGARDLWPQLVGRLIELEGPGDIADDPQRSASGRLEIADWFFREADRLFAERDARATRRECVFISHQRADAYRGERVACLASHRGVDVWLDVQNPTLRWLNTNPNSVSAPAKSLLIAAIVEIGLLNSTHVIALHTPNSRASRWVPYELARAKARGVTSTQAAGWFEGGKPPATYPSVYGDYVQLAVMTFDEGQVFNWLPGHSSAALSPYCRYHMTKAL